MNKPISFDDGSILETDGIIHVSALREADPYPSYGEAGFTVTYKSGQPNTKVACTFNNNGEANVAYIALNRKLIGTNE